jgi:hypothetical protein
MSKPHTNGFWQNPLPVCQLGLETLHLCAFGHIGYLTGMDLD